MELWTDYEGITIDGAFPLNKLLLPEGRSAFFSTFIDKDDARLIRLIACHFDEDEILARWRGVEAWGHPNFVRLERSGQLTLDNVTVIYAVLERVEANLAQVLAERRLTVTETTELAVSVASALETLHTHGFVHEHIAPENVFAVGETVKVRSDCIREAPEGESGVEAKQRDVHDLAVLLLDALTQTRTLELAVTRRPLPAPFDRIVPNAMNGAWGIREIVKALQGEGEQPTAASVNSVSSKTSVDRSVAVPAVKPVSEAAQAMPNAKQMPVATAAERPPLRIEQLLDGVTQEAKAKWIGALAFAVVVFVITLWLGWHFLHAKNADQADAVRAASVPPATVAADATNQAKSPAGVMTSGSATVSSAARNNVGDRAQWRVIAYTYYRQDQAQKKAQSIAQAHPELRPEVFTPTHRAPYLVTIGGVMSRDQAYAFARQSRNAGLPHDTYAQNYSAK
ncbi:hypothetical protein ACFPT7_08290 [Acidicapsa dinghuensis]|uniref:Protein kinase domain-containing protein n=1 Tax=Acidicapsa dinghuensis TaxID=2218256 RepID=A0ABW1EE83_9BACT|nr:hypothetical protein [Acidicapsa dinghuensis]